MELQINQVRKCIWTVDDGEVREYLVIGTEQALLLDTGAAPGVKAAVKALTSLPVIAVNSHAHGDHTGGNAEFQMVYASAPAKRRIPDQARMSTVTEGDSFDLGGCRLEVLALPGHTAGDIGLLCREEEWLLAGDAVQKRPIVLDDPESSALMYRDTLRRLLELSEELPGLMCYPAHGDYPVGKEDLQRILACTEEFLKGRLTQMPFHVVLPGIDVWTKKVEWNGVTLLVRE